MNERDGKTKRTRAVTRPKSATRARSEDKSQTETATAFSRDTEEQSVESVSFPIQEELRSVMHKYLPALIAKIGQSLRTKPEHFITHPAELRVLHSLSESELLDLAHEHGWRFVRRVGGRQIEFYNDAGLAYRPMV